MSTETRRELGLYLLEHLDVIEDVTWHEAVEAYVAMRDQRNAARETACRLADEVFAVRDLHKAVRLNDVDYCEYCSRVQQRWIEWPCKTAELVYPVAAGAV